MGDARENHEFNEKLIAEVESRRSLWDTRKPEPKYVRDEDWKLVAAALGAPEEVVQKRWKNLRDTYLRNLRTLESSGDRQLVIRWYYFERLMFLYDCVGDGPRLERSLLKCKYKRPRNLRKPRLPPNPRWLPPAKSSSESAAEEAESDGEPEPTIENDFEEESIECEEVNDPTSAVIELVPIDCERAEPSPVPSSETSSRVDDSTEQTPASPAAVNTGSPILSDVRSLAVSRPAAVDRCVRRRRSSLLKSSPTVPDSSGDVRLSGKVAGQLDNWDHFLASLKMHLRSTPNHLVGNAQMHLLQVAVGYGAGKPPTALLPLGTP